MEIILVTALLAFGLGYVVARQRWKTLLAEAEKRADGERASFGRLVLDRDRVDALHADLARFHEGLFRPADAAEASFGAAAEAWQERVASLASGKLYQQGLQAGLQEPEAQVAIVAKRRMIESFRDSLVEQLSETLGPEERRKAAKAFGEYEIAATVSELAK
jgi:hypothetical protein